MDRKERPEVEDWEPQAMRILDSHARQRHEIGKGPSRPPSGRCREGFGDGLVNVLRAVALGAADRLAFAVLVPTSYINIISLDLGSRMKNQSRINAGK